MAEHAVAITTAYVKERTAFGKPLIDFQNTRFTLAECKTAAHIGRVFLDNCIERFMAGRPDDITAATAKYWLTHSPWPVVGEGVQAHRGGGAIKRETVAPPRGRTARASPPP